MSARQSRKTGCWRLAWQLVSRSPIARVMGDQKFQMVCWFLNGLTELLENLQDLSLTLSHKSESACSG